MDLAKEILEEMGRQHHWLQPLEFKFRNDADGIRALSVVNGMARNAENRLLVTAILGSNDWGRDANRTQVFWVPINFDWTDSSFAGIVGRGIESIHVSGTSPLKAIITGRRKKHPEAEHAIIEGVFPRDFQQRIAHEWDVNSVAFFDAARVLPVLCAVIEHDGQAVVNAEISCWSGNIRIAGRSPCFCDSLDVARNEIEGAFNTWIEEYTSTT